MTRRQRIRFVIALTTGLAAPVIGTLLAQLVAAIWLPSPTQSVGSAGTVDDLQEHLSSTFYYMNIALTIWVASCVVSGVCLLYCYVSWARWFIGPKPIKSAGDAL